MTAKKHSPLITAFLLPCLLSLAACAPDFGVFNDDYKKETVEVSTITTPTPAPPTTPALYCNAGNGEALFGKTWREFSNTLFVLHQGDYSNVAFGRAHGTDMITIQAFFDTSGQKMIFCPFTTAADPAARIACTSLYTIEDDLKDGIKRTFEIPGVLRGAMISCAYARENLKTLTPPVDGGL